MSTRGGGHANIWLLDLIKHEYTNLTKHASGNFRPSWSPDGKWIAFTSDRDTNPGRAVPSWELLQSTAIYIGHPDGTGFRRLTESGKYYGSPQWSRDGKRIVCYQSTPKDVFPGRSDGSATSQIVSIDVKTGSEQAHTSGPGFKLSPRYVDGQEIGYIIKYGEKRGLAFVNGRNGSDSAIRSPAWSPDGKILVYQKTIRAEPNRMTPAFSRDPEFELFLTGNFPAYSPDGARLAYSNRSPGRLMLMDADGTNSKQILDVADQEIVFPSWSPDGKSILFAMGAFFTRPPKPAQVAVIGSDGSNLRMLTKGEESSGFPSWSPDGKRVVYRVMGKGEQGLRIMNLEDGKVTKLTTEYDTFPAWSPKGDLITFTSFRDGDYEMYMVRTDGSQIRKLTNTRGNDGHATWSPDGKWIIFSSSRMGFKDEAMLMERGPQPYGEMFAVHADGTDVRQLTDNQWEDATPAWLPAKK